MTLINREDAIDELRRLIPYRKYHKGEWVHLLDKREVFKALNALPPAEAETKCVAQVTFDEDKLREIVHEEVERIKEEYDITDKWIPCSDRLPKENGWYQCTVVLNDLSQTMELFYKNGKWLDNRRINMFDTYDIYGYGTTKEKYKLSYQELISEFDWTENVVAWMPLSKPYRKEQEHE